MNEPDLVIGFSRIAASSEILYTHSEIFWTIFKQPPRHWIECMNTSELQPFYYIFIRYMGTLYTHSVLQNFLHNFQAATCTLNRLHEEKWSRTWHACLMWATNQQMLKTAIRVSTLPSLSKRKVCNRIVGTSISKDVSGIWIGLRIVFFSYRLQIIHLFISSFSIGIEVQKLQEVKWSSHTVSIFWEHCPINLHRNMS